MDLFEELIQEKDNIMMSSLGGGKVDMTKLRELARECSEAYNVELTIDGTDQELWSSVTKFLRGLLDESR